MTDRFYANGTIARFNSSNVFQMWIVAPLNNTLAPVPTNTVVNMSTDGTKSVYVNNTLTAIYYPPTNINSTQLENFTGILYKEFASALNTRIYYRNGSSGIQFTNGTFVWRQAPISFFVPFYLSFNFTDGSNITTWADGKQVVEYPPLPESATEFQKAVAIQRRVRYALNNTEIQFFFNQTIAEFRNGSFFGYIVPPKNFLINVDTTFNTDGS